MQNRYDLVIYGATGFAGSVATKHLMESSDLNGMRVAVAGRNQQKLEDLQKLCNVQPDIIIADSNDQASVDAMVQNAKVVLNFAGPFAKYAEPVIAACAKLGTHYLDITGETAFTRTMIDRYQEEAQKSGARLVPFCGFDSVPADLTTYLALKTASEQKFEMDELCLHYQIKGGLNGGSLATALNMAENNTFMLSDSNILIPDENWPQDLEASRYPRYESTFSRWSAFFHMSPTNNAVVRRSAWLRSHLHEANSEPEPVFHYEERLLMPQNYGFIHACLTTAFVKGFGSLSSTAIGRELIRACYGLKPGQGPSEEERLAGIFNVQLVGRSNGQDKLIISMERQGDPSNEITSALAIECARLMVTNDFATEEKGFLTPSVAFGMSLFENLKTAGFHFKTELVNQMQETKAASQNGFFSARTAKLAASALAAGAVVGLGLRYMQGE